MHRGNVECLAKAEEGFVAAAAEAVDALAAAADAICCARTLCICVADGALGETGRANQDTEGLLREMDRRAGRCRDLRADLDGLAAAFRMGDGAGGGEAMRRLVAATAEAEAELRRCDRLLAATAGEGESICGVGNSPIPTAIAAALRARIPVLARARERASCAICQAVATHHDAGSAAAAGGFKAGGGRLGHCGGAAGGTGGDRPPAARQRHALMSAAPSTPRPHAGPPPPPAGAWLRAPERNAPRPAPRPPPPPFAAAAGVQPSPRGGVPGAWGPGGLTPRRGFWAYPGDPDCEGAWL
jgi:hypothetical protein